MLPRRQLYVRQLDRSVGVSLARLSALEGLARSTILGVLPLVAIDALDTKSRVSIAYLVGTAVALLVTLNLGTVEGWISRKWTVTLGLLSLIVAAAVFATSDSSVLAIGIALQAIAASTFSVGLSLYIMDFVDKRELTRNESKRMVYNAAAWLIGPSLGVWLLDNVGRSAPFIFSIALTVLTIVVFWYLRLSSYPVLSPAKSVASNPLKTVPRFFSQKKLRISYTIILVRSIFWASVFVYGPLYVREAGLANWVSGAFLSGMAALLFFAPVVSRLVSAFGVRALMSAGFSLIALGCTGLGVLGEPRPFGLVLWGVAAVGAGAIDVVGNVPFMRLVKPRERVPMTTVFSTWRQVSAMIAPAIAALVLIALPFRFYYAILAMLAVVAVVVVSYLPRRLS